MLYGLTYNITFQVRDYYRFLLIGIDHVSCDFNSMFLQHKCCFSLQKVKATFGYI